MTAMMRTLAERFRTLRSDRIRVDGAEVRSIVEIPISSVAEVEVLIESYRSDTVQRLVAETADLDLGLSAESGKFDRINIASDADKPVHFVVRPSSPTTLRFWNSWVVDDVAHAWTGNAGVIVEDLAPPDGAESRQRLWCSDGLGDSDFSDLVAVITIGLADN